MKKESKKTQTQHDEVSAKKQDEYLIRGWLGDVPAHHIRFKNVYDDRYRVDVFNKHHVSGSLSDSLTISDSYFVRVKDGVVNDLTIKETEEKKTKFI